MCTLLFWCLLVPKTKPQNIESRKNVLGVPTGVKKTGRSLLYKNKNFGVEKCELHVWKGLNEWNNFKKACYGLKSILFMLYRKT